MLLQAAAAFLLEGVAAMAYLAAELYGLLCRFVGLDMAVPAARSAAARSAALIMLFIMIANVLQVICHAETYGKYVDIEIYL